MHMARTDLWQTALQGSGIATIPPYASKAKAIPFQRAPNRRVRPRLERSLSHVKSELLETFRDLVTGRSPWPLFLFGDAGAGKSRAALALCDHVPNSYYLTIDQFCSDILVPRGFFSSRRYLADYNLTVVDELATRKNPGDLEYSALKMLADIREDLPAIYITNISPAEVAVVYDDRIASRILCGTAYHLIDADRRMATRETDR